VKIPLTWLRDYVELPESANEIAAMLASLGFPVESIAGRPKITGVVVGRIDALEAHPEADRLQLCVLDIGNELTLTIVTAATNVAVGQVVPVATIGAVLPEMTIAPRKMRGIASQGMLCSAAELGLEGDWFPDGIMQLDHNLILGADVVELFGLHDPIFEVEVTSNRADVLSVLGVARELAAAYDRPLQPPPHLVHTEEGAAGVRVHLESGDVQAFTAQRISHLQVGPAPSKIAIRLALAGQRPISALVDISNYVMLEIGQPLHFYDAAAVAEATLIVRDAGEGERLTTLDGVERLLDPSLLVVADPNGALALAGIRGGAASEISATTTSLILECAAFRAARIRRGADQLGLRTEASARFEKNLAPALIVHAAARAAYLLAQTGAVVHAPILVGEIPQPTTLFLPRGAADRLIGISLTDAEVTSALERLGFTLIASEEALGVGGGWEVWAPYWRSDIAAVADLIEEIARIVGYERIEATEAIFPPTTISSERYLSERALANRSAELGFVEVITFSLESAQVFERFARAECAPAHPAIEIRNPLSEEQRFLRFSVLPGLLESVARRAAELREGSLMLFEISHVFPEGEVLAERGEAMWILAEPRRTHALEHPWRDDGYLAFVPRISALLAPFASTETRLEPATAKGFHPGKTARLLDQEHEIALIGALDPRLKAAYDIDADCYIARAATGSLTLQRPRIYHAPSRYPGISRDLALLLPQEISAAALQRLVTTADPLVSGVRVFDDYRDARIGVGRKSLALRVLLQSEERTLTDAQADAAVARILAQAQRELGAVLRT
jgi:phenylalanyl-tRNA synthetase beta chain